MTKPTVGIITMHGVLNCGSALQAYALQEAVNKLGFKAELIDYVYPNAYHKSLIVRKSASLMLRIADKIYSWLNNLFLASQFRRFRKRFFKLSKQKYTNERIIKESPPEYDYYISGSDQIWNPKYVGIDTNFFLGFVDSKEKFSYASSISNNSIKTDIRDKYVAELRKFKDISVREKLSTDFIQEISGRQAQFVLDPSMLLSAEEWEPVVRMADCNIKRDYILVYILGYSFDVYDYAARVINQVQEATGKEVLVFVFSRKKRHLLCKHKSISKMSPENFLYLIKNASLVITDSFHASALSLVFSTPLYPLIKDFNNSDNRVRSLLTSVGAEDWLIAKDTDLCALPSVEKDYSDVRKNIEVLRNDSIEYLKRNLN